jgi:hypothetical protein
LLTDQAIALDVQLRAYFRDKIVGSLKTRGLDVVVDPNEEQHVSEAVATVIEQPARLVEASQRIAKHLDAVQSGRNSSGLIVVVKGDLGAMPGVGSSSWSGSGGFASCSTRSTAGRSSTWSCCAT